MRYIIHVDNGKQLVCRCDSRHMYYVIDRDSTSYPEKFPAETIAEVLLGIQRDLPELSQTITLTRVEQF